MAIYNCDLTGISCEGRELFKLPGNPSLWIAPSVKLLLLEGHSLPEIRKRLARFDDELGAMTAAERAEHFKGSFCEIR